MGVELLHNLREITCELQTRWGYIYPISLFCFVFFWQNNNLFIKIEINQLENSKTQNGKICNFFIIYLEMHNRYAKLKVHAFLF